MPWTVKDVDRFKKGLTTKKKKQWVAVANSVLKKCMEEGGNEETCAASAVKQANGVSNNQVNINITTENYTIKETEHQGKEYLVVPVIMMVEGVHNGSDGPILHTINELGKIPDSWNGRPITISHPQINDNNVSANIPEVIDSVMVGQVYNTFVEDDKLKAEAWLDKERLQEVSPKTYEDIKEGKVIEVSVGIFSDQEEVEGEWKGEKYHAIAYNYRPDHLALLPEEIGACSINDGCGIRVNNKHNEKKGVKNEVMEDLFRKVNEQGFSVHNLQKIIVNEDGYLERIDAVRMALYSRDRQDMYHYLEELYGTTVIYSTRKEGSLKMYKQSYTIDDNDLVTFVGDPIEVIKKVDISYIENNSEGVIRLKTNKKEVKMSTEKCLPCIENKVNALIANKAGHYKEDDREWLSKLDESQLDKISSSYSVVVKKEEVQVLSDEDKKALDFGKKQLKQYRENLIKDIQDNTDKETWPDDILNNMDDDTLKRIHKSVIVEENKVVNFSLNGSSKSIVDNETKVEPLLPTGIVIE